MGTTGAGEGRGDGSGVEVEKALGMLGLPSPYCGKVVRVTVVINTSALVAVTR